MLPYFLTIFRTLWLRGRPGGGKTSLSIKLAMELVNGGYAHNVAANTPLNIGIKPEIVEDMEAVRAVKDTVIILDEAWQELGVGVRPKAVTDWMATIRHRNQYLVMPSVQELTRQAGTFSARRLWNGYLVGIPLWLYRWDIAGKGRDKGDTGKWLWWNPKSVFGFYDHRRSPDGKYYIYRT